jgi:hypothetical protein
MHDRLRRLALALLLVLGACAQGPKFAQVAPSLPPLPPEQARIYFYRYLEPYETLSWTTVYLNRQPVGNSAPGTVFFRDVPPGPYYISVRSEGVYPNQFKTVSVDPHQTLFVRIESLSSWDAGGDRQEWQGDTFVVDIVDPRIGSSEIQNLAFSNG